MYIYVYIYCIIYVIKRSRANKRKVGCRPPLPLLNSMGKQSGVCTKCQDEEKAVALVDVSVKSYVFVFVFCFGGFARSSPGG